MNDILERHFVKKYPKIFAQYGGDPKDTCMAWGVACGDGWFFLLDNLCRAIQWRIDYRKDNIEKGYEKTDKEIPQVVFEQVKEKFGGLRIYYTGGDPHISAMVSFSETLSMSICENCGAMNHEVGRTKGWIQSLCTKCSLEYEKPIKQDEKMIKLFEKVLANRKNKNRSWKTIDDYTKTELKALGQPKKKRKA